MDLEAGGQKVGDPRGSVLTVTVADDKDTVNDVPRILLRMLLPAMV